MNSAGDPNRVRNELTVNEKATVRITVMYVGQSQSVSFGQSRSGQTRSDYVKVFQERRINRPIETD
jgi:hypothetical protein